MPDYFPCSFAPQRSHEFRKDVTTIMLALMGPVALVGAAVSYLRLNLWAQFVLMRYRTAPPGQKARRIYKFQDAREVGVGWGWGPPSGEIEPQRSGLGWAGLGWRVRLGV